MGHFYKPKESVVGKVWLLTKQELELLQTDVSQREHFTRALYQDTDLRNGIHQLLVKFNNSIDFDDLFQTTIISFLKSVVFKRDIQEINDVRAYAYTIARNRLLSHIKVAKVVTLVDDFPFSGADIATGETLILESESKMEFRKIIGLIGDKCRDVLMYWSAGYSMEEIAEFMEYKSAGMAKKKKYECLNGLITLLENKPAVKQALYNLIKG